MGQTPRSATSLAIRANSATAAPAGAVMWTLHSRRWHRLVPEMPNSAAKTPGTPKSEESWGQSGCAASLASSVGSEPLALRLGRRIRPECNEVIPVEV